MKRWFRHHAYALKVALRRLAAQPFSSLSNIGVISLILTVPVLAASLLVSVQPVVRSIPVSPEITLFMSMDAPAEAAAGLATQLHEDYADNVASLRVIARDEALQNLRSQPDWADALSVLPENPLPDAIVVTLNEVPGLAALSDTLASQWRQLEHVDTVQLDSEWVRRLAAILGFLRLGLGLLAGSVAIVVLATVFNTVRMQALTQREEIAVARLVGATEAFVRRPFLYLGALTGVVSSLLATAITALALVPLNKALQPLAQTYGSELSLHLPDVASLALALIVVTILAALSARWSVTRHTHF